MQDLMSYFANSITVLRSLKLILSKLTLHQSLLLAVVGKPFQMFLQQVTCCLYNNAYRLGYVKSDSASNMFVYNRVETYDAHNRHLIYSLRARLLDRDNPIIACLNECLYIRGMWTSWRESMYM